MERASDRTPKEKKAKDTLSAFVATEPEESETSR